MDIKKYFSFIVLTMVSMTAFSQGVVFQDITFAAALKKAKAEKKLVFVDCYTSWCGPCKQMMKNVFAKEEAGAYFNDKYICLKYDMEKGEGPVLLKRYGVTVFPTCLLITPEGKMQHKIIGDGIIDASGFIKLVEGGLDEKQALGSWIERYQAGCRDKAFLKEYIQRLRIARDATAPVVAEELIALSTPEENASSDYWFLFGDPDLTPARKAGKLYLLGHRNQFNITIGKDKVDARISHDYMREISPLFTEDKTTVTLERLDELSREIPGMKLPDGEMLVSYIKIGRALKIGNVDLVLDACQSEFKNGKAQDLVFFLDERLEGRMNDAQKTRWEKLKQ